MKVFTAKVLLAIVLCAGTPLGELVKLPLLVSHMISHLEEDPQMSLVGFFHMHYNQGIVLDEDFQQDMQLPFKTSQGTISFVWGDIQSIDFPAWSASAAVGKRHQLSLAETDLPSSYLSHIWQPPRHS